MLFVFVSQKTIAENYPWLESYDSSETIINRVDLPEGYERIKVKPNSFENWLRYLPLKKDGSEIFLYNGQKKYFQENHVAVIDIDIGDRDLQQCADAYIRLRAEYLYSTRKFDSISFNYTSGDRSTFRNWINGLRPDVRENQVNWIQLESVDSSYSNFKLYLEKIFTYAGTYSLTKEMIQKANLSDIMIGDVLVQGGFPGHLVFVVDICINNITNEKLFLLAQGFTPAQDYHILKNPINIALSPWYSCKEGDIIRTPEWIFKSTDLMSLNY